MLVEVHVPTSLREFAGGARKLRVDVDESSTVGRVFECLHVDYPGVVERALDEQGRVRPHVNVFVDGENVRAGSRLGLATPVRSGAEIWILPAVSGGSGASGQA
jgi:molybdopterin converting factor small subunit